MKRQRPLLPGAFPQLNLSRMQYEEERRNELLAGFLYRLLGLGIGLVLAAGLIAGLYETYRTAPPATLPATTAGVR